MLQGFTIPRAIPDHGVLLSLPLQNNHNAQELLGDLNTHKGSEDFDLRTNEISSIESIHNSKLIDRFSDRRNEMRADGYTVRECYGFVVTTSHADLEIALQEGSFDISLVDSSGLSLVLGDPSMGLHVFKNAENALLHYGQTYRLMKFSLVMLKIILARGNIVKAQPSRLESLIEPQPAYDHHLTKDVDCQANQLIYVYEYNADAEVITNPRSILPIALFNYELKGHPFKRIFAENQTYKPFAKRKKVDAARVASIIKRKKEEAFAAAEEAKQRDTEQRMQDLSVSSKSPIELSPRFCQFDDIPMEDSCSLQESIVDTDRCSTSTNVADNESNQKFKGASMIPVWVDIVNDCFYDPDLSVSQNLEALALSAGPGVAYNDRTMDALRRCGQLYCEAKESACPNSLIQITRKLPQDSPLASAFHLVVGFLRYQLGYSSVQSSSISLDQSQIDVDTGVKNEKATDEQTSDIEEEPSLSAKTKDAEIQCVIEPDVLSTPGPDIGKEGAQSAVITCSVMIQCNLGKINNPEQPRKAAPDLTNSQRFSFNGYKKSTSEKHPFRPVWMRSNNTDSSASAISTDRGKHSTGNISSYLKPQHKIIFDELPTVGRKRQQRLANSTEDNDDAFVLRLIIDAVTDGTGRPPSQQFLSHLEEAFFDRLDRMMTLSEKDNMLLELANYAQQGRWEPCLDILGLSSKFDNTHGGGGGVHTDVGIRSRVSGNLWAQSITEANNDQMNCSKDTNQGMRRKISRYADDIFHEDVNSNNWTNNNYNDSARNGNISTGGHIAGKPSGLGGRPQQAGSNNFNRCLGMLSTNFRTPMATTNQANVSSIANQLGQSILSAARIQHAQSQNVSIVNLRNALYQRRSEDLANALRSFVGRNTNDAVTSNNHQRSSSAVNDLSLYSGLMNMKRHY